MDMKNVAWGGHCFLHDESCFLDGENEARVEFAEFIKFNRLLAGGVESHFTSKSGSQTCLSLVVFFVTVWCPVHHQLQAKSPVYQCKQLQMSWR